MVRQKWVRQSFDLDARWEKCVPGTIGDLQHRLNNDRRRKSVVRMGAPIVVTVLLGMGIWNFGGSANPQPRVSPPHQEPIREFHFGGVTCSELQESVQQFAMGQLKPARQQAFAIHLQQCPVCQKKMNAMSDQAMDIVDDEVSRTSNINSQTHRVLIAAIAE